MNRLQHGNWIPGGVLRVYSKRRGVWHFGIPAFPSPSGPMVMHGSKDRGVFALTSYEEFAEGQPTQYTWIPESLEQQQAVLSRAESMIGRPFRLLNANCEDFVNGIITGLPRSPQREKALTTLLLIVLVGGCLAALAQPKS